MRGVKLPTPPDNGSQLLLQAIWDLAGPSPRWPTYAELDRYLDLRHDQDALGLIRATPLAFVYGVDRRSPVAPSESQEIGLTVAGAAACSESGDTLDAFVQFVRKAAELQRLWAPSTPTRNETPSLTKAEAATFLEVPGGLSERLLTRLYLLLNGEPWGGAGGGSNEAEGTWIVNFDRRVRAFRDVVDLEDYWERRYRPQEWDAELAPALKPAAQAAPTQVPPDRVAAKLAELGGGVAVSIDELATALEAPGGQVEAAADVLHRQGAVVVTSVDGRVAVALTEAGRTGVKEAEETWNDRRRREPVLRDLVMGWLYDVEWDSATGYVALAGFVASDRNSIAGHAFSEADLDRAAAFLEERALIEGTHVDQRRGPVLARLTASGISCMEKNQGVARYLEAAAAGTVNNFYGPVSGTNLAWGDNAHQRATSSGVDADGLRTLAQAIIQALPGLSLPEPELAEVHAAVSEVTAAAGEQIPDKKRLGRALVAARHALATGGNQALSIVISAAVNHALAALGWSQNS